jgi:tetratricopeptide (TPR) repeat protein
VADRNYWVRTEQGRTWGPFTLTALERLRGQLTEKSEASLDGTTWRPGTEFPELRELLAPARKVEKKASLEAPPPRISRAMAEAFGIKEGPLSSGEPAAEKAPDAAPLSPLPPSSRPSSPPPSSRPSPPSSLTPPRAPEPPPVEEKLEVPGSGDLSQLSALRLCALAALTSASGLLVLELEKGSTLRISFRRGTPEHLSTDDLDHSLLRFLQRRGVLPAASALAAEEQAAKTGQEIVSVLFQLQLIPPADAHRLLGEYAIYLLDRALLSWRGKFSFEKDAPSPPGAFPLGSRWTLLAESVRRLELPLLRARLGKRLLRPVVRSGGLAIGKVEELALNAQESRLYASLDGTRTCDELLKSQDPGVTVRLLYLLSELGHLAFAEMPEEALPDLELEPAKPASLPSNAERAPEQKQRQLPKSAREAGRSPPPAAARTSKAAPPVMQSAAKVPQPPATPPPILRPPPVWAVAPPGESPAAALERIAALLEQFAKADHFEVLGVERKTATAAEAKRNFFVLAKELHPDTVTDPSLEDLRNLKEQLFARINAAAQVLSDDKRRKEYEDELAGKKDSVDVARIFAAEESFQRAEIMIKARKYQEGLDLIEKAISMNAEEGEFYAWRGYAKFLLSKDRKQAFDECADDCRKAIKMIDKCLPAHLFLGHMAKVVGDMKLAQKCYQRVLELEPTHIEAQRELRLMGKKG